MSKAASWGLKAIVDRAMRRAGYTIIPDWRLDAYPTAVFVRRLFEYLEVDLVVDVGANIGQFGNFLRSHVGYAGGIVSFEPVPENLSRLITVAEKDGNWKVRGQALGAEASMARFNVMEDTQFSSFLNPDHGPTAGALRANNVRKQVEVQVRRLDDCMEEIRAEFGSRRPYLKLDTQGFDLEVVKGGSRSMTEFVGLQLEASVKPIYHGSPGFVTSIEAVKSLGFELSGIFPNNDGHFPLLLEFDCYMVNAMALKSR